MVGEVLLWYLEAPQGVALDLAAFVGKRAVIRLDGSSEQ